MQPLLLKICCGKIDERIHQLINSNSLNNVTSPARTPLKSPLVQGGTIIFIGRFAAQTSVEGYSENDFPPPCTRRGAGGGLEFQEDNI